jgi:alkanesulfonate monooxygenase SsuD/methylene tetrahydromethanopterin reductase-like flavin-dependent oxidoreductase (luciferase family)
VGGAIGGLAAAVALRFVGAQVDVYEQATLLGEVGAGVALAPDSLRLGLAEEVSPRAAALDVVGIRRPAGHAVGSRCWRGGARMLPHMGRGGRRSGRVTLTDRVMVATCGLTRTAQRTDHPYSASPNRRQDDMIETWGFSFLSAESLSTEQPPTTEQFQAAYDRYLDLWTRCDRLGFDGLAFAEHHFSPLCLSPSPHLVIAALASRTETLRFTTLGSVLPLHDARRYVEEIGMLDYLTHGRFEPGIAPGAGDREAVLAGVASAEIRPRYYSGAELLGKAVESPYVTHQDAFYDLERVLMIPTMRPETGRAIWVTVMSGNSAEWAGQRGYKLCTAFLPTPVAAELATRYRAAAEAVGHRVDPSMLGLRRRVFVAETDAEAQDKHEASVDKFVALAGWAAEAADSEIHKRMMHPDDFAVGSPATVAAKLIEQCRAGGYGAVMAFTDFAQFSHEDLMRSHELLGREVAPVLRSAEVGSAAGV